MSNPCNDKKCETDSKPQESCDGACPIEEFTQTWEVSFCQAMQQTMVAKLQERIEAQWGEMIGKEADALVESMCSKWGVKIAGLQAHQARESFKQTLVTNWLASAKD